jgi:hypothetical protein
MGRKNTQQYLGPIALQKERTDRYSPPKRISETDIDFFPGSIKPSLFPGSHEFYCALACIQLSLEKIPESHQFLDAVINQMSTDAYRKLLEVGNNNKRFAVAYGKYMASAMARKKFAFLFFVIKLFIIKPVLFKFVFNQDFRTCTDLIYNYIINVFNRDPDNPKVTGSSHLYVAVVAVAECYQRKLDPYEHDRKRRPLSAEVSLTRPKTIEGRKKKTEYDKFISKYPKHTDRYYLNGAKRWLEARVLRKSVAEAERELQMDQSELNKYLYKNPWDDVMGYQKN